MVAFAEDEEEPRSSDGAPGNASAASPPGESTSPAESPGAVGSFLPCLCVFDIDRTLTGKQSTTNRCPRNRVLDLHDAAYGGGRATLSALAAEGISRTFCDQCLLGIVSAGHGSGQGSPWNDYILESIMRSQRQDEFTSAYPSCKHWSFGSEVTSPYVLGQRNRHKQDAVELMLQWYAVSPHNVSIRPSDVYFFGDHTENIRPFGSRGFNSHEISCARRDHGMLHRGEIGLCGATPEEIVREPGNHLCK